MNMQTATTHIRNRGQITLPYTIRDLFSWTQTSTPITVVANAQNNSIILQPITHIKSQDQNWQSMWQKIELARSFYGTKDTMSGSEFIAWDRQFGHRF